MTGVRRARPGRRGRPRAGERPAREEALLDAAFDLVVERGAGGVTMSAIAGRAGASKETLYTWFGDRAGLLAALVRRNAEATNRAVEQALHGDDVRSTLRRFAAELLTLLLSERALAVNRAAIAELPTTPELADVLRSQGRERTGPLVEAYLAAQAERGTLHIEDPGEAFRLLYGLVVRDAQIIALLGGPIMDAAAVARRADDAVDRFLALVGGDR